MTNDQSRLTPEQARAVKTITHALANVSPGRWDAVDALDALVRELEENAASFEIYDSAVRRGTKDWQRAKGKDDVWPDTAALVAWLVSEHERLEKYVTWLNATLQEKRAP